MADRHPQQSTQWLNWYTQQYGAPQKDPSTVPRLTRTIADYLHWMKSVNYTAASRHQHRMQLELFLSFVKNRRFGWQQLFTEKTREHFKKIRGLSTTAAVNGLSRYLVGQGQLKTPLPQHPQQRKLAGIFEDYLQYRQDGHQTDTRQLKSIRRVLSALCDYFNQHGITLNRLRIEDLDAFMAEFWQSFASPFCRAPAATTDPLCAAF
jgi:site-specific recombinase XerD